MELLGVGGMGAVYKAEHQLMERTVAVKVINANLVDSPAMVERFRREVKAAARLTHANIVTAYDADQAGSSHFLVMEYVEGTNLARLVAEKGPLPVSQACDYIRQAALGLQHAFDRGMVHRDIKPQNLMLARDGQVKVLDFGLARFALENAAAGGRGIPPVAPGTLADLATKDTPTEGLTQTEAVMGTPDYIAPEQSRDSHAADIRADIYSLGCTLYELLAGQTPFPGGTGLEKLKAHIERMPKPLTEIRRSVPAKLASVVERMMAKDPNQRYQTPAAVAEALASFAGPAKGRTGKYWIGAAIAVLACALGLVGWLFGLTHDRVPSEPPSLERQVEANQQAWQFGFDLPKGYVANIRAGGKWRVFPMSPRVGPGGHDEIPKASATDQYVQSGANRGCLLVRTGDTVLPFSQDDETINIGTPGPIYFCCNDERTIDGAQGTRHDRDAKLIKATVTNRTGGFADNSGALKVTITLKRER